MTPTTTETLALWTVDCDYFATGEGRTVLGLVTWANDEREAKALFVNEFGTHFGLCADAGPGVRRTKTMETLFSEQALSSAEGMESVRGTFQLKGSLHYNLS